MAIKDAILSTIAAELGGRLVGRRLLQKKLYFLGVLVGEEFAYSPYFYGPYSVEVADNLGALVAAGFVAESVDVFPDTVGYFGERRRYEYQLTHSGRVFKEQRLAESRNYASALESINSSLSLEGSIFNGRRRESAHYRRQA